MEQPSQSDIVALTEAAILIQQKFRTDKKGDTFNPRRRTFNACKHRMHNIAGELVVATGNPYLVAKNAIATIGLGHRFSSNIGQTRASLGLRQGHSAGELTAAEPWYPSINLRL